MKSASKHRSIFSYLSILFVGLSLLTSCAVRNSIQQSIGVPVTKVTNPVKSCQVNITPNEDLNIHQREAPDVSKKQVKPSHLLKSEQQQCCYYLTHSNSIKEYFPGNNASSSPPFYILYRQLKLIS